MQTAPTIQINAAATRRRIAALRQYVEGNLLRRDQFVCPHYDECLRSRRPGDEFREGTMSHVGKHYDLRLDGQPLRIVVVGQESGWPKDAHGQLFARRVTLDDRYKQVHDVSGIQRRYYAESGFPGRNPHMRGTTSALRVLLGKELGSDYDGEVVRPANGRPFHLFDAFALVNRLLCSAGPAHSSQGHPTRTMLSNCDIHFGATMRILEPTLVILQGKAVAKWARGVLAPGRAHSEHLHEAQVGHRRVLVCTFSHPSAHGPLRWGDRPDAPYLIDVVVPTLRQALARA